MASVSDYEHKAKEAEALAANARRENFRAAFKKLAEDYRALARKQRELNDGPRD